MVISSKSGEKKGSKEREISEGEMKGSLELCVKAGGKKNKANINGRGGGRASQGASASAKAATKGFAYTNFSLQEVR